MKKPRHRFALSREADGLIHDGSGQWERVELFDGPAAQKLVPGVRAAPTATASPDTEEAEERDPDTLELGLE